MNKEQFSMWDILILASAVLCFVTAIWPDCDCRSAIDAINEVKP